MRFPTDLRHLARLGAIAAICGGLAAGATGCSKEKSPDSAAPAAATATPGAVSKKPGESPKPEAHAPLAGAAAKGKTNAAKADEDQADENKAVEANPKAAAKAAPAQATPIKSAVAGDGDGDGLAASKALNYIPGDAIAVAIIKSPQRLIEITDYQQVLETHYRARYAEFKAEAKEHLGVNPADPDFWTNTLGIDLSAPMGVALVDPKSRTTVAFMGINDSAKLMQFLTAASTKEGVKWEKTTVGDATIFASDNGQAALVFRGGQVLVASNDRGGDTTELAKRVAGLSQGASLAASAAFAQSTGSLKQADDGLAWVNLTPILAEMTRHMSPMEKQLAAPYLNSFSTLAIGGVVTSGAFITEFYAPVTSDSPLRKLVGTIKGVPGLFAALDRAPLTAAAAQFDANAYVDQVLSMFAPTNAERDAMLTEINTMAGVDIQKDVLNNLSGEIAFALDADIERLLSGKGDVTKEIGGAWVMGLKDAESFAKTWAKLAAHPMAAEFIKADKDGGFVINSPDGRMIHVAITKGYLAVSTDKGIIARLDAGTGKWLSTIDHAELKALVNAPNASALWTMDMALPMGAFWAMSDISFGGDVKAPKADASAELKADYAKYTKIKAEADVLRIKVKAAQRKKLSTIAAIVGTTGERLTVEAGGFRATIGQYLGESPTTAISKLAGLSKDDAAATADEGRLNELDSSLFELGFKLRSMAEWKTE